MPRKQNGQFDKIFKENIDAAMPTVVARLLKIDVISSEDLPDNVQHTKERRPDVLKKITDVNQNTFILHLEIQLSDEPEMVYRMAEYDLMLQRKYKIPIEQYVIYIGKGNPVMPLKLISKRHKFEFQLITLSQIDYKIFLNSNNSGEIVFAILGNFRNESPQKAVRKIIERIHDTSSSEFVLKRHLVQLRVLSQIRKLETITQRAMESIDKFFKEEKDFLYMKGREKGVEQGIERGIEQGMSQKEYEKNREFTRSLISQTAFNDQKIAGLVDVSVEFVAELRKAMDSPSP